MKIANIKFTCGKATHFCINAYQPNKSSFEVHKSRDLELDLY
jgi:hypothetical protein